MKKLFIFACLSFFALSLASCGKTENATPKPSANPPAQKSVTAGKQQTMCPVMNVALSDKKIFVDYKGKRIYFCCNMCPPAFNKEPEKYMKQMEDQGIALEPSPEPSK